ncbi:MAG: hypothetical protein ACRD4P_10535 [Bryobacteraceae bacterium]
MVQALICLFLLNNARPALFENWTRPWKGPNSIWATSRDSRYFADMSQWPVRDSYPQAVNLVIQSGCKSIGIDASQFQLEYPFEALLLERDRSYRFTHVGVKNVSAKYTARDPVRPCAILCLRCAGLQAKVDRYRSVGAPVQIGDFLLFTQAGDSLIREDVPYMAALPHSLRAIAPPAEMTAGTVATLQIGDAGPQ